MVFFSLVTKNDISDSLHKTSKFLVHYIILNIFFCFCCLYRSYKNQVKAVIRIHRSLANHDNPRAPKRLKIRINSGLRFFANFTMAFVPVLVFHTQRLLVIIPPKAIPFCLINL